jgi:predicted RNase H-like nuclease (RuvC/YqgF family)
MDKEVNEIREMIEQNWERIKALEKDVEEMKTRVEKLEEKYSMEKHIMVSIVGYKKENETL